MDACVPAFTADDQASDTNGSGAGHSGLDTIGHRRGGGGQDLGRGVGHGGLRARVAMRRDLINLCQNSWDALQAARRAL
jgi:hypothetical protein